LEFQAEEAGLRYSGVYAERLRTPGSDIDVCFSGNIAVTRIALFG
jgi:5'-nucleotidase